MKKQHLCLLDLSRILEQETDKESLENIHAIIDLKKAHGDCVEIIETDTHYKIRYKSPI